MNILDTLNWRYATKKFSNTPVTQEKIDQIIESARLSASSYGFQPFKLIQVKDLALRAKLVEVSWGQEQVKDASHLFVLARAKKVTEQDIEGFINLVANERQLPAGALDGYKAIMNQNILGMDNEKQTNWMSKQLYIMLGNMMYTAAILKVDTCPMEGFSPSDYDKILGLEEKGLNSVLVLPVGYRAEDDKYQHLKKARLPKEEFLLSI